MPRSVSLLMPLLIVLAMAAPAGAAVAPFAIPDPDDFTLGAGPGSAGRMAFGAFNFDPPGFLPPVVWTVGGGHRRPARRPLTADPLPGAATTFTPAGALVAHTAADSGAVSVAQLALDGTVISDTVVSDADPAPAAPGQPPIVGADGTIAVLYVRPPGDSVDPAWLTLQPRGIGPWTAPVALPRGAFSRDVFLAPDGSGVVVNVPAEGNASPLLIQRVSSDGTLGTIVRVDLTALRPPKSAGWLHSAATITDAGTLALSVSVPGVNDDRHRSHLALITLPASATEATVQEVGKGADGNGGYGTLDIATSGGDRATVLAGDGAHAVRVFDVTAAAAGSWTASTIPSRFVKGGRIFRRAQGGLSVIWAEARSTGMPRGRLMATHRDEGGRFVTPHRLSKSPRAQGRLDVHGAVILADDEVLVAYGNYGRSSLDDRSYAVIGRP